MSDEVLSADEVAARVAALGDWQVVDGKLHRELEFRDFRQAFAFMAGVALEAERLDHHPDWANSWNRVTIDVVSHSAGGLTDRCFRLAEAVDRHAEGRSSPF